MGMRRKQYAYIKKADGSIYESSFIVIDSISSSEIVRQIEEILCQSGELGSTCIALLAFNLIDIPPVSPREFKESDQYDKITDEDEFADFETNDDGREDDDRTS